MLRKRDSNLYSIHCIFSKLLKSPFPCSSCIGKVKQWICRKVWGWKSLGVWRGQGPRGVKCFFLACRLICLLGNLVCIWRGCKKKSWRQSHQRFSIDYISAILYSNTIRVKVNNIFFTHLSTLGSSWPTAAGPKCMSGPNKVGRGCVKA